MTFVNNLKVMIIFSLLVSTIDSNADIFYQKDGQLRSLPAHFIDFAKSFALTMGVATARNYLQDKQAINFSDHLFIFGATFAMFCIDVQMSKMKIENWMSYIEKCVLRWVEGYAHALKKEDKVRITEPLAAIPGINIQVYSNGSLEDYKSSIVYSFQHSQEEKGLQELAIPPSALMAGAPGTGKSYFANVLANSGIPVFVAPEIHSKYIGESQQNLTALYDDAMRFVLEKGVPFAVVFLDEIERIAKNRQTLSDGDLGQGPYIDTADCLLNILDGPDRKYSRIVTIGTTNLPLSRFEKAFTRPGRLNNVYKFDAFKSVGATSWIRPLREEFYTTLLPRSQSLTNLLSDDTGAELSPDEKRTGSQVFTIPAQPKAFVRCVYHAAKLGVMRTSHFRSALTEMAAMEALKDASMD